MKQIIFWVFAGITLLGLMARVVLIGKPREPYTAGGVCISLLIDIVFIWAIYTLAF